MLALTDTFRCDTAVIVTVPVPVAVTTPFSSTMAMPSSPDMNETRLLAFAGTVATLNRTLSLTANSFDKAVTLSDRGADDVETLTVIFFVKRVNVRCEAVIIAAPVLLAVIFPLCETDATALLPDLHFTFCDAASGLIAAIIVNVCPTSKLIGPETLKVIAMGFIGSNGSGILLAALANGSATHSAITSKI
jgi:hypothetical protein